MQTALIWVSKDIRRSNLAKIELLKNLAHHLEISESFEESNLGISLNFRENTDSTEGPIMPTLTFFKT